jgi:hypothetical protein
LNGFSKQTPRRSHLDPAATVTYPNHPLLFCCADCRAKNFLGSSSFKNNKMLFAVITLNPDFGYVVRIETV